MKYSIIYAGFLCLSFFSCKPQQRSDFSDKERKELIEQERANENRSKYGESNVPVVVIEDPAQVAKLKEEILRKKAQQKQEALTLALKKSSITQRYKKGDKTVVPQIIAALKGSDAKVRKEIYSELKANYEERGTYTISEQNLIQAIFHNLTIVEDEKDVVQLVGFMNLPGYVPLFEQLLFSGKAQEPDRIIYWLGHDGSSLKTIQYLHKQLDDGKFDPNKTDLYGIGNFYKNGNAQVKKAVFDFCYDIYTRKLIAEDRFKEIQTSYSSDNPAIDVLNVLLDASDKKIIPVALKCLDQKIFISTALTTLIKLDFDTYKDLPLTYLRNKDTFYDALEAVVAVYKKTKDEKLTRELLVQFEKMENRQESRIVSTLTDMGAEITIAKLETILTDKTLVQSIQENYELTKGSIETIAADLHSMGVVEQPVHDSVLKKAHQPKEDEFESSTGYIYDFLDASGVFLHFDAETDVMPVDYAVLIEDFFRHTNGKLKDFIVGMDANDDAAGNVNYKITIIANNKAYTAEPPDIGDWYDLPVVLNMVNKVLADASLKERFNFLDTGDQMVMVLFGPPDNVKAFATKYKLSTQ